MTTLKNFSIIQIFKKNSNTFYYERKNKMKKIIDKDIKNNKKYNGSELRNKIYNHLISQGYSKEKVINIINTYDF